MKKVSVFVKAPAPVVRPPSAPSRAAGLEVSSIQDKTPIPHSGCCRPKEASPRVAQKDLQCGNRPGLLFLSAAVGSGSIR